MLDVHRRVDIDPGFEQLQDVLPTLAMSAAGGVAMRQLIDQCDVGAHREQAVQVQFEQGYATVLAAAQRLVGKPDQHGCGFRPTMSLHHPHAYVAAKTALALRGLEHGVCLAYARRRTEKYLELPASLPGSFVEQRIRAHGIAHSHHSLESGERLSANARFRASTFTTAGPTVGELKCACSRRSSDSAGMPRAWATRAIW